MGGRRGRARLVRVSIAAALITLAVTAVVAVNTAGIALCAGGSDGADVEQCQL